MKTNKALLSVVTVVLLSGILVFGISGDNKEKLLREGTAMYFPTEVDFAGEKAPLQITDVRERLDRELLINANLDATTALIIKRANRAFPIHPNLADFWNSAVFLQASSRIRVKRF